MTLRKRLAALKDKIVHRERSPYPGYRTTGHHVPGYPGVDPSSTPDGHLPGMLPRYNGNGAGHRG